MKLKVYTKDGSSAKETEFKEIPTFEGNRGRQALKEVIVAHQANARQGTAKTKTRSEVRGGGRKPWRQKGTGNARAGSNNSPIWTGGGTAHGPKVRDYNKKINRKVKALAIQRAFYDRVSAGEVEVIESLEFAEPKTRLAFGLIRKIAPEGRVLLVEESFDDDTIRATRNLAGVDLEEATGVNALRLAAYRKILFTRKALDSFVGRLNGGSSK